MESIAIRTAKFDPAVHGEIEREADELFRGHFGELPWDEGAEAPAEASDLGLTERWFEAIVGDRVAGFAHAFEVGEYLHLEQLSVDPAFARRGIGRALVEHVLNEAAEAGFAEVTLRTFADVPWNAPFYASCGFRVTDAAPSEFHEQLVRTEDTLGLLRYGARVHMIAELRPA